MADILFNPCFRRCLQYFFLNRHFHFEILLNPLGISLWCPRTSLLQSLYVKQHSSVLLFAFAFAKKNAPSAFFTLHSRIQTSDKIHWKSSMNIARYLKSAVF